MNWFLWIVVLAILYLLIRARRDHKDRQQEELDAEVWATRSSSESGNKSNGMTTSTYPRTFKVKKTVTKTVATRKKPAKRKVVKKKPMAKIGSN